MRLIDADKLIEFVENRYDITWKDDYEGGIKDACTDILEEINKLPSAEQWIPCSDRLPDYGVEVLTYSCEDDYEINHIIDEEDGEWFSNGVIAWMPLPEPYTPPKK